MISRSKLRSSVDICADCGASDPSWASINRGLLLCAECCSVHRSMGRHISHVKSLRQGTWPPSLLAMVHALTAQNVNSIWEHSLLDTTAPKHLRRKPQPKDSLHPTKAEFILAKHLRLAYVLRARRDEPAPELGRQLHSAVRSTSLDTAVRLLAQGADPNYFNQEKGTACLHVACRAGHSSQAELLVAWGADPTSRDASGHTPADCARQGGHGELAERLVELVYDATDRLIYFLTGRRPEHAAGQHYVVPQNMHSYEMTDMAKAARGKLQLLPNHLFEELVMDIYDEVDRRETEAVWQTSAPGLERSGVAFLPVNPALSAPRNQGRQKLARLSAAELAALVRDVLVDAARRQHIATLKPQAPTGVLNPLLSASHLKHISQMSDDEPLYDSVASDEDYAALLPIKVNVTNILPRQGETVSALYNPSIPNEQSCAVEMRNSHSQSHNSMPATSTFKPEGSTEIETLKKELDNRDSTISELKSQLRSLQTIVERLTHENSSLKTSVDDSQSLASQNSTLQNDSPSDSADNRDSTDARDSADKVDAREIVEVRDRVDVLYAVPERGKSVEGESLGEPAGLKQPLKSVQRPVSMYETREGPKNNWQVTKHQLTTISGLDRTIAHSLMDARSPAALPSADAVHWHAESVTRGLQELWAAAQEQRGELRPRADSVKLAVRELHAIFPEKCCVREVREALAELQRASEALWLASRAPPPPHELRATAYDLAKATKMLVTHFPLS